jgi:hypothetical protein
MSLALLLKFRRSACPALLVLLVLAAVSVAGLCLAPDTDRAIADRTIYSRTCEPRLPLDLTWVAADSDPALPGTALTLVMTARTNLPSVRLELQLPPNVALLDGPGNHQGKLGMGETRRFGFRVSPRGAANIQARVTAVTLNGLVFQKGVSIDLAADGGVPVFPDPGRLVPSPGGGRQVREYTALPRSMRTVAVEGEGRR